MNMNEWLHWLETRTMRDGKCLIWKRAHVQGVPQASVTFPELGIKKAVNVRRALWEAKVGRPPRKAYVVVCTCGVDGCVEPSHLKEISRSQLHKGRKQTAAHRLACTIAARQRKTTKLSEEDVRAIRHGDESAEEMAARYGVTAAHVWGIRRNAWCREVTKNPFAGLM